MKIKNLIILILVMQIKQAVSCCYDRKLIAYKMVVPSTRAHADGRPLRYYEIYNPLFQAVFEGDLVKFESNLAEYKDTLYQKVSYNRTIRHFAYSETIDEILKSHLVAPSDTVSVMCVSAEKANWYDSEGKCIPKSAYIKKRVSNPAGCDIYGRYPEDYSKAQRFEMAMSMVRDLYTGPVK